ncbi:methionine--tRNA ligase [Patescibacteria group bacterium]|nr:methionine--tRNA ligase [Patescibacteria group bacterium]
MSQKFYITTSIAYANSNPHIGFAMESIQADVLARYFREKGYEVFFQTGTDEHGSKIQRTAELAGKSSQEFVDDLAEKFMGLKGSLNLSWDNFVRTSNKKMHWPVAEEIWNRILKSDDLYKKKYEGYYCVGCESFKTGRGIVDGQCSIHPTHNFMCGIHKKKLELIEEENWFFKLSKYTKQIEEKIKSNELVIVPEGRKNETLSLLKEGLEDISFSRSKKSLEWGIPVPDDSNQTMYVWVDALTNYISGYRGIKNWEEHPADLHVIGKDILRFHSAIWPAILMSSGLPLPKKIFVHGFITSNGEKMSKSLDNVIDPYELVEKYGTDAVRYYLLREISSTEDGDFSYEKFEERYNGDLANGLGNFTSRVLTLASKEDSLSGKIGKEFENKILETKNVLEEKIKELKFNEALATIWELIQFGDIYINENKPWSKEIKQEKKTEVIYNLVSLLKEISNFLLPFLPETVEKISESIQLEEDKFIVKKIDNLFPRLQKNKS